MARRRPSTRSSFGIVWLGLLGLVVVSWMGWRSGWWPVNVAPAETTVDVENSSFEQARRAAVLESRVSLPEQFEPPITTPLSTPRVISAGGSSFPAAAADQAGREINWRPTGSRPTVPQVA